MFAESVGFGMSRFRLEDRLSRLANLVLDGLAGAASAENRDLKASRVGLFSSSLADLDVVSRGKSKAGSRGTSSLS